MLDNVSAMFEGNYGRENSEIVAMRDEVLHKPLPSFAKDRANLKSDRIRVIDELQQAFQEYKDTEVKTVQP